MMTTQEAVEMLGVSRQTLYLWRRQGLISIPRDDRGHLIWDIERTKRVRDNIDNHRLAIKETKRESSYFQINNRRYLGSKEKLLPFINQIVSEYTNGVSSVADIFAGTGVVANMFASQGKHVIINDILHSNYLVYKTFFGHEQVNRKHINSALSKMNSLHDYGDGYLEKAYGNRYFSQENANKISSARQWVEDNKNSFNDRELAILITSIIYGSDKVANTVGHYDAYRKKMDSFAPVLFKPPLINKNYNSEIFEEDANDLVKHIYADLIYIDTPYNSRQYVDTYHVLENIADWNKPEIIGVARKSTDRQDRKSKYNLVSAPAAFNNLITHINAKYVLVSFNNMAKKGVGRSNSKISHEEIMESLKQRGQAFVFEKEFKPFSSGKSQIRNHKELLYLLKVDKND